MTDLTLELESRRATVRLGHALAPLLERGDLVVLCGQLGAGKTFLARAICRGLGLSARVRVTSPTFSLIHEFETRLPVSHADLYRVKSAIEVRDLGLDAARDDGRLLLVEWGEPFVALLGGDALLVRLESEPRRALLSASGPRAREILRRLKSAVEGDPRAHGPRASGSRQG